jgi:hypothetical protein
MPADQSPAGLRPPGAEGTEVCPGCGAVALPVPADGAAGHPGASPSCARLFEVTVGALREDVGAEPGTASVVGLADAAYDAQHPDAGDPERLRGALERLGVPARAGCAPVMADPAERPTAWRTTIADVAADLDVIDLGILVTAWADSVREDWSALAGAHGS